MQTATQARATTQHARNTDELPVFKNAQAWRGDAMAKSTEWIYSLNTDEIREIEAAIAQVQARKLDLVSLSEANFALPKFGQTLKAIRADVLLGRGFVLFRGWPADKHSVEASAIAFRGIGAHFGEALSQNAKGHVLGHVKDLGLDYNSPTTRGYQTTAELRFHTDGGDVVALICLRPAKSGGLSRIASSTTVWNEIVRRRPDLAQVLTEAFYLTRWGEVAAGQKPWAESPLFMPWKNRMIAWFVMSAIEKGQALPGVPKLTAAQREAMDAVNAIAAEDGVRLDMDFRVGDMQFVNNHFILHSRTEYEDWTDFKDKRHLLRLWLSHPEGPELPAHSTRAFQGTTESGRPNGIQIPGVPLVAPLEAC